MAAGREKVPPACPEQVAVVVLNHNGRSHLVSCLEAVLALEGLAGPQAVLVADNGSTDGSLALVADRFPGVRRLQLGANLGFAAGNNRAAAAVQAGYVLFLNNDTRVAPSLLRRLAERMGGAVACAGARLVSWNGRWLDFDGGGAAFTGHGHALGFGRPVAGAGQSARPTLFTSGAAMLVHRPTFLAVGGFDPDYFCYYEDVDLGWRLWLAGYEVWHIPQAVVRHRHGATARRLSGATRTRLYERNAIATVAKNYDREHLGRVLPAALALAAHRAGAGLEVIATARPEPDAPLPVPDRNWTGWSALQDLELDLQSLTRRRTAVQAQRRRGDGQILPLLALPLVPVPPTPAGWAALRLAVDRFALTELFGPLPSAPERTWVGLLGQALRSLAAGGPGWVVEEARRYLGWRRATGRDDER